MHFFNLKLWLNFNWTLRLKCFNQIRGGEFKALSPLFLTMLYSSFNFLSLYSWTKWFGWKKKHRKIINQGLDMLAQASIPLTFWDDFFYATMFMINRFPTYVLNHLSPLEKLFHVKPNLYFLKVFGCLCFSFFWPYNQHKFRFQSEAYVFLGYNPRHKGYKYLISAGKLYLSRHVVFHETLFAFLDKSYTSFVPSKSVQIVLPIIQKFISPKHVQSSVSSPISFSHLLLSSQISLHSHPSVSLFYSSLSKPISFSFILYFHLLILLSG